MLIVGISAVIIAIFLAVAFNKSLQHPIKAMEERREGVDKTHNMEAGLQLLTTGISSLKQPAEVMRRGSAGDNSISRIQQKIAFLGGRKEAFRGPNRTDSPTPGPIRSEKHRSWRRG